MGKAELRREVLSRVKGQGARVREEKDKKIRERFLELPEFQAAGIIAVYVSFGDEVDTRKVIKEALTLGKRVVVPVVVGDEMHMYEISDPIKNLTREGPFGIPQPATEGAEPLPGEKIDLIAVPGVAFTREGKRLGRGKGFYDRFFRSLPDRTKKVGLAYDLQIVEDMPAAAHDVAVDIVLTNRMD